MVGLKLRMEQWRWTEVQRSRFLAGDQSGANAGPTKLDMVTPLAPPAPEPKSGVVDD